MSTYAYRWLGSGSGSPEFERRGDVVFAAGHYEPVARISGNQISFGDNSYGCADLVVDSFGRVHSGPSAGFVLFAIVGNKICDGGEGGDVLYWCPENTDPMLLAAAAGMTRGDSSLRATGRTSTDPSVLCGMDKLTAEHWRKFGYHGSHEVGKTNPDGSDWYESFDKNHLPGGNSPSSSPASSSSDYSSSYERERPYIPLSYAGATLVPPPVLPYTDYANPVESASLDMLYAPFNLALFGGGFGALAALFVSFMFEESCKQVGIVCWVLVALWCTFWTGTFFYMIFDYYRWRYIAKKEYQEYLRTWKVMRRVILIDGKKLYPVPDLPLVRRWDDESKNVPAQDWCIMPPKK